MENEQKESKLLSLKDAAGQMGISRMTVYRMVRRGDIPSFRIGQKSLRVSQEDVNDYVQKRKH